MKRFVILVIALLTLSGTFAQQKVDLELQGTKTVPIILGGPDLSYPVVLSIEASYQPEKEVVKVVLKPDDNNDDTPRITPTSKNTKDQVTHLLFLFNWDGFRYDEVSFESYFKKIYSSSAVLETPMKEQTNKKNNSGKSFRSAFEINNGKIENGFVKDTIVSLKNDRLTLEIKVLDLGNPVALTINNVIPLRAKNVDVLNNNKYYLKFVSDSCTISFNIPECAKEYDLIRKYESLNSEMSGEVKRLKEYVKYVSVDKDDINRIVQRQWPLIYKYEKIREEISALDTKCEKLFEQFADFNDYYNQIIGVNALTPDSIQNMIDSLDLFRQLLQTANDRISCKEWKDEAVRYIAGVEIDEEAFDQSSKVYELVVRFNKLKKYIEEFNCPVEVINTVTPIAPVAPVVEKPLETPKPATKKPKCKCSDAAAKFETAANRIDDLIDKRRAKRVDNSSEFNSIVKQMDNYWNELDESCKTDKQCAAKYELYKKMKNSYNTYVK